MSKTHVPPVGDTGIPPVQFYASLPIKSTPIKSSLSSIQCYTSTHVNQDPAFGMAATEMKGKFTEISAQDFLSLLPNKSGMPSVDYAPFKLAAAKKSEVDMYNPFIEAMTPFLKSGWVLANVAATPDLVSRTSWVNHRVKPDVALYKTARVGGDAPCDASEAEAFGEFKIDPGDEPFRELSKADWPSGKTLDPFEKDTAKGRDTRGQLALYLNAIQSSQHRTRVFSFYIRANFCRLLCHSRSGTLVTPLIDYTNTDILQTFFWRLTHADKSHRGIDTTFIEVFDEDPNTAAARKALQLDDDSDVFKVGVGDKFFYVSEPFTSTHTIPVGRSTRCYTAYDPETRSIVLLKDTWRVLSYTREDEIYTRLHAGQVPNIPDVVAAGDVPGEFHYCGDDDLRPSSRKHKHYRIVIRQVGRRLSAFKSTHQFVTVILDAFIAHRKAYELGILHRDISFGNIIIYNGRGLLIDWELSVDDPKHGVRAPERTGTWQFLSIDLLTNRSKLHDVADDIESFVYVMLWTATLYAHNRLSAVNRAVILKKFDYNTMSPEADKEGMVFLGRSAVVGKRGVNLVSKDLSDLLIGLVVALRHKHEDMDAWRENESDEEVKKLQKRILTHDWMENVLGMALRNTDWQQMSDGARKQSVEYEVESAKKRKKTELDFDERDGKHARYETDDEDLFG